MVKDDEINSTQKKEEVQTGDPLSIEGGTVSKGKVEMLQTVKDAATLELLKPVGARVKNRIKALKELSRAKNTKIMVGEIHVWQTVPPKVFINRLRASVTNGVGLISYQTYKMEGSNKKVVFVTDKIQTPDGVKEVILSAEYPIDKMIVERIEDKKPIHRQVLEPVALK